MIKEFLEKNTQFKITIQHLSIHGGGFLVRVYNTTLDPLEPAFQHFISDFDIAHLKLDFETTIMTPVNNWLSKCEKAREVIYAKRL